MTEWISVKDRMPDLYQWVLVTDSTKGTGKPRCINIWRWDGKVWDTIFEETDSPTFSDIIYHMNIYEVTHWMPLPEEPKDD